MTEMPETVDVRSHKFQLAVEALVLGVVVFTELWPLILVLMVAMIGGIFPAVFRAVLAPRLGAARRVEDVRLPRFATIVGLAFMALTTTMFVVGLPAVASGLALAMAVVAAVGAFSGWCLPCEVLMFLARLHLINPKVPIACPAPIHKP